MLKNTTGVPLPLKGGAWKAPTDVKREEQYGNQWCWAACVAMVLKGFKNYKNQCTIAQAVWETPCDGNDRVKPGYDIGYDVNKIKDLWKTHDVPADYQPNSVGWDVIESELRTNRRPVEIFLGVGKAGSIDGHVVLIVGAETTAEGKHLVSIADPKATNNGLGPTDFDSLEREIKYGTWKGTWTNLFWKEKVP